MRFFDERRDITKYGQALYKNHLTPGVGWLLSVLHWTRRSGVRSCSPKAVISEGNLLPSSDHSFLTSGEKPDVLTNQDFSLGERRYS